MAVVWRQGGWGATRGALLLYAAQLACNALWSWLFFAWRLGAWSFLDIVLLWGLIVLNLFAFARHSRWAAGLLLPYLLWVSFAAVLCFSIWQRNPDLF